MVARKVVLPVIPRYIESGTVCLTIINIHVDIAEVIVESTWRRQLVQVRIVIQERV